MRRKRFFGPLLMFAVFLIFPPAQGAAERTVIDQAHIIVNEKMVTKREMQRSRSLQERDYRTRLKGKELEAKLQELDKVVTTRIIETLLLEARAEQLGIQITDEEIDERVNSIIQRDPRISGVYTDQALKEFVVQDLLQKRVVQREVNSRIFVGKKEIIAACREEVRQGREMDVGHILVRGEPKVALAKIEKIKKRLAAGTPFEEVALDFSEDPAVSRNKGRMGFIARGQFVKAFEEAAFALAPGEVVGPVKTKFGYHMIKVFAERLKKKLDCEKIPERTRKRIRGEVWNRLREAELSKYLAKLKKDAEIIVLDQQ